MAGPSADYLNEIKIAGFWRRVLGEMEYVDHDADDLKRWYEALEQRGAADIRETLIERASRHPVAHFQGLGAAPHPSMKLVELWLSTHEEAPRTTPVWIGIGGFAIVAFFIGTGFSGCQSLRNINPLVNNPQTINGPIQPEQGFVPPPATSTLPQTLPPPSQNQVPASGQQQGPAQ